MEHFRAPVLQANPKSDDWTYFKRQFSNFLSIVKASDDQKLPLLLNSLSRDGLDIYDGLPDPKDSYDEAILRFDSHFSCR